SYKDPWYAYFYAMDVRGVDRRSYRVMSEIYYEAMEAYYKAINSGHTEKLQEITCKHPGWAYNYAKDVKGADIRKCQEMACKDPYWACWFARDVKEADLDVCLDAVRGSKWENELGELVIEMGIG